jgi:hypothetical protein
MTKPIIIIIIIIVIFITGLHKMPQGCSASVASVAGPFTTKKKNGVPVLFPSADVTGNIL